MCPYPDRSTARLPGSLVRNNIRTFGWERSETLASSLRRFESLVPAMSMIKEGADYGFEQTHHTGDGRRGDGRSIACICSADWARRSCHVVLRKRRRSYPL